MQKRSMREDELLSEVKADVDATRGTTFTEVAQQRTTSMDYYFGLPYGNEVEGRSQIVTTEVSDTIE